MKNLKLRNSIFLFVIFICFLSCEEKNIFDGKYSVESTMITVTGDLEDKTIFYEDCINKEFEIRDNKFIYSDTLCFKFGYNQIKTDFVEIKLLESKYPDKLISLLKGNYKTRGVIDNQGNIVQIYKRLDNKLIVYDEPYLLVLKPLAGLSISK